MAIVRRIGSMLGGFAVLLLATALTAGDEKIPVKNDVPRLAVEVLDSKGPEPSKLAQRIRKLSLGDLTRLVEAIRSQAGGGPAPASGLYVIDHSAYRVQLEKHLKKTFYDDFKGLKGAELEKAKYMLKVDVAENFKLFFLRRPPVELRLKEDGSFRLTRHPQRKSGTDGKWSFADGHVTLAESSVTKQGVEKVVLTRLVRRGRHLVMKGLVGPAFPFILKQ